MLKTFKTAELIDVCNNLDTFIAKDISLPVQFAWNLEDNFEAIKKVCEKFEKHRAELLKPLQDKGAFDKVDDNQFKVKPEFLGEFQAVAGKIEEYLQTVNELEIKTVKKSDIPEMISAKDLRAFRFMIDGGDEND